MKYLFSNFHKYLCLSSSIILMGLATSPHAFQQDSKGMMTKRLTNLASNETSRKSLLIDVISERGEPLAFLTSTTSDYSSSIISSDELTSSLDAGYIEIRRDRFNNLGFQIVETGTINIVSNDFYLDILDIDTFVADSAEEFNILFPVASYLVTDPDQSDITATTQSATFLSTVPGDIPNLDNLNNLSSPQEDLVVRLGTSGYDQNFDSNISVVGDGNSSIKSAMQSENSKN